MELTLIYILGWIDVFTSELDLDLRRSTFTSLATLNTEGLIANLFFSIHTGHHNHTTSIIAI